MKNSTKAKVLLILFTNYINPSTHEWGGGAAFFALYSKNFRLPIPENS